MNSHWKPPLESHYVSGTAESKTIWRGTTLVVIYFLLLFLFTFSSTGFHRCWYYENSSRQFKLEDLMIRKIVKDHVLLEFWPCMCLKNSKIQKQRSKMSKNIVILTGHWWKSQDKMRKCYICSNLLTLAKKWRKEGRDHVHRPPAPPTHPVTPVLPYRTEYKQQNVISNVRTQHGSRDKIAWESTTTTVQGCHHIGKTN